MKRLHFTHILAILLISLLIFAACGKSSPSGNTDDKSTNGNGDQTEWPTSGIVFVGGQGPALYYMNEDGGDIRQISPQTGVVDNHPSVSPDGKKIVFVSHGLWIMNIDGSSKTQIVGDTTALYPTWSPDGQYIYYSKHTGGDELIFRVNIDGTGETQISPPHPEYWDCLDRHPSVSPDGTKIAFTTDRDIGSYDGSGGIAIMNIDGSGLTLLPTGTWESSGYDTYYNPYPYVGGMSEPNASWSPNGTKIVFAAFPSSSEKSQIYVMNSDGSGITKLTNETTAHCYGPAWSPDGTKIVFYKEYPMFQGHDIWIMNSDGSSVKALTDHEVTGSDTMPCFIKKPR